MRRCGSLWFCSGGRGTGCHGTEDSTVRGTVVSTIERVETEEPLCHVICDMSRIMCHSRFVRSKLTDLLTYLSVSLYPLTYSMIK